MKSPFSLAGIPGLVFFWSWMIVVTVVAYVSLGLADGLVKQVETLKKQVSVLEARLPAPSVTAATSPAQTVQTIGNGVGQLDMGSATGLGGTPLEVSDYKGDPELWMVGGSLYLDSDKGRMIGGNFCIVLNITGPCLTELTNNSDLILYGQKLTPADIRWIHKHGG